MLNGTLYFPTHVKVPEDYGSVRGHQSMFDRVPESPLSSTSSVRKITVGREDRLNLESSTV